MTQKQMTPLYDNFDVEHLQGEEVVLVSHYDLDAVGATYFAQKLFNVKKKACCGYAKMLGKVESLIGHAKIIVFVDVCAKDDVMQMALDNFDKVFYADHHLDSELYAPNVEKYPGKFFYLFDHDMCASRLIANKLGFDTLSGAELQFEMMVQAYDLWQTDSKWFQYGYHLNTLFWDKHFFIFLGWIKTLPQHNKISDIFDSRDLVLCKSKINEIKTFLHDENNFEAIEEANYTARIYFFPEDCFFVNDVLLQIKDLDIAVGINIGSNVFSVRTKLDIDMNDVVKICLERDSNMKDGGGHKKAIGVTVHDEKKALETAVTFLEIVSEKLA